MFRKEQLGSLFSDIRFWIFLFFLLRLIGITNAPLEIGHNWRQSLTNMIARNFYEDGANLFYPRVDMAGERTGILGSEFPFYNYLIYLTSLIFDYAHWYGRLINLFVSSIGTYFFYLLSLKLINKRVAFNATIILLSSIWFAFSRKIMPDTFSVSLVIIGLYCCYMYLQQGMISRLVLYFVFVTLGMLCKIPALSLLSPLVLIFFIKKIDPLRKTILCVATTLSLVIVFSWYFYWVPYLVETFRFQLYFPKELLEGLREIYPFISGFFEKFYFSSLCSFIAFACFMAGIVVSIRSGKTFVVLGIATVAVVFGLFILKTGSIFPTHNYYIIPFTPVMALIAGWGIATLKLKTQYLLLFAIAAEGIANQQHDFFIKGSERYKMDLEKVTSGIVGKNELIVINGGPSPQLIYFSHCKGWTVDNNTLKNEQKMQHFKDRGARYLVVDKRSYSGSVAIDSLLYSDDDFAVYKLQR